MSCLAILILLKIKTNKKMRNIFLTLTAIAGLLLTSCGGNSNKEEQLDTLETSTYENDYDIDDNEYEEELIESFEEIEEEPVVSTPSKSNEDWDAYLKSYEKYIDQYVQMMKKAQSGDMSAMLEYAEMLENMEDMQKKMESVKGELSASQMARFTKLQYKMIESMESLK